jgi:membrane protease YdiL (CAAX protease family)
MENALVTLFLLIPFLVPVFLANFAAREPSVRILLHVYLGFLGVALLLLGLICLLFTIFAMVGPANLGAAHDAAPPPGLNVNPARLFSGVNWLAAMWVSLVAGVLAIAALFTPARRVVAKLIPIDPDSPVHMAALSLTAVAFGLNLFQLIALTPLLFQLDQKTLQAATQSIGYLDILIFPLFTLTVAAFAGVGLYMRRDQTAVLQRLGLVLPTPLHLVIVVVCTATFVALSMSVEQLWRAVDPAGIQQVGGLSEALLGKFTGITGALAIGLSAAIGEELFFRGAYQPRMGIVLSTLLFTAFHVQYGFSFATLLVFVIGLVLGILRNKTSLTVCILIHFLYNFTLVMLGSG